MDLGDARGLLGLVLVGEGLFITLRVVPHESVALGLALALAGTALLWRARLPRVRRAPRAAFALAGLLAAVGVLAHDAWRGAPLAAPKVAIVALGLATAAAAVCWRVDARVAGRTLRPDDALVWALPLVWGPLGLWATQGAMKAASEGTVIEAFVRHALLAPLALVLGVLGRAPTVEGQVITYATPSGPFALEVGVACSGLSAMALFVGIVAVYVAALRPAPRTAVVWLVVGLVGVHVTNVARLVALALVGSAYGEGALQSAHAHAGWMFFVAWTAVFSQLLRLRGLRVGAPA